MNRMKYTMLITALAAVALGSVGCQQKIGTDKVGKSDHANSSVMSQSAPSDQTAQSSPPPSSSSSSSSSSSDQYQTKPDQNANSAQTDQSNPPATSDKDTGKARETQG